jgi:iron complex outermembrane receptor protein
MATRQSPHIGVARVKVRLTKSSFHGRVIELGLIFNNRDGQMRQSMVLLGALGLLGVAEAAHAQESADQGGLEDIIVTARRQEERLQDAPISVTAFTASTMERLGIDNVADIARRTPGLQYGNFGDVKLSPTSLRGIIGSAGSAGSDPAVGYYVDEVFVGQGAGANLDLYDIARVEVLRGPQGTLFGRNTVGGVISLTTARPGEEFEASAQASYGNYDYTRLGAAISGPLSDNARAGLSAVFTNRDGTSDNVVLNRDVNTLGSYSIRAALDLDIGEQSSLQLNGDYRGVDDEPLVFETIRYNDASLLAILLDANSLERNADPYDRVVYTDDVNREELDAWGVSARFNTRIGGVDVTNIASYRKHDYYSRVDTDRSALRMAYDGDPEEIWRASEELRFNWSTGSLAWLAGVYYYVQDGSNQSFIEIGADLADLFGDPSLTGVLAGSDAEMTTTSAAAFGSVTWSASDRFDITLGGRYVRDEKEIDYSQSDPLAILGGSGAIEGQDSWTKLTPSINLRYRLAPDVLTYLTVSQGFKSGGFNDALGDANGIAFDPETVTNYEFGLKSELFDRRLTANLAVFYMDWSDIQISQDNPVTPVFDPIILNAGAAHSQGIELEIQAAPTDQLLLGANLSLLEAEFDEGTLPSGQVLRRIPQAPEYTAAFNAEYTWPVASWGELSLGGEYLMRGESFLTLDNIDDGRVDPYQLLNLRLTLANPAQGWRIALWGENVTDETYKTRMFDLYAQDLVGQRFIILGDPATYGIDLRVSY